MKKIMLAIVLTVICSTVSAQINPKFTELENYMQELGIEVSYTQCNRGGGIEHERYAGLGTLHRRARDNDETTQHYLDSVDAKRNRPKQMALDSIRRTFSALSSTAAESYMFEYHRGQQDTIEYSIAFAKEDVDSAPSFKHNNAVYFKNMREVGRLHFHNNVRFHIDGTGLYAHTYFEDNPRTWEQLQEFDAETFQRLIEPLFQAQKEKGVKSYPIYWRHDEGYADSVYFSVSGDSVVKTPGGLQSKETWSYKDHEELKHTGLTTGMHYLIPLEKEELALELLHCLDSMSQAYVNAHPEQRYIYKQCKGYQSDIWETLVSGMVLRQIKSCDYRLNHFHDEDGFHIVSIATYGELWVPRDWTKLKSWINGEKTYLKGMKPKD